jgi:peptidoglycan/xylan/chitin deacetylase (PgdA/CDA1 family)
MKPFSVAARGKSSLQMIRRAGAISGRYGLTSAKINRILSRFVAILADFSCTATFPITAAVLGRSADVIEKYQAHNIEFAAHGYHHVDHTQLSFNELMSDLARSQQLFQKRGIQCVGFRCPYLRWNETVVRAVEQSGFQYEASPALAWDLSGAAETLNYAKALRFYGAVSAKDYPALPKLNESLVRIPYCLPDDESLDDRLRFESREAVRAPWLAILSETYRLGELFTLGLHPERINRCEDALVATLSQARALSPAVWIARLDEIARWWEARAQSTISVCCPEDGCFHITADGPDGLVILVRGLRPLSASSAWDDTYRLVEGTAVDLEADCRPFVGVSPASDPHLADFLRQQGYIVETAYRRDSHSLYLDWPAFVPEDQRLLLDRIEQGNEPLVRLGRWPGGARSALSVTGDIDALTIWDYVLRFVGS